MIYTPWYDPWSLCHWGGTGIFFLTCDPISLHSSSNVTSHIYVPCISWYSSCTFYMEWSVPPPPSPFLSKDLLHYRSVPLPSQLGLFLLPLPIKSVSGWTYYRSSVFRNKLLGLLEDVPVPCTPSPSTFPLCLPSIYGFLRRSPGTSRNTWHLGRSTLLCDFPNSASDRRVSLKIMSFQGNT